MDCGVTVSSSTSTCHGIQQMAATHIVWIEPDDLAHPVPVPVPAQQGQMEGEPARLRFR
jgi:hypothetical protein